MDAPSNSMWNLAAQTYDRVMRVIAPGYGDIAARARRAVAGSERVLEVACGTGLVTLELAREVARVEALDASPTMIGELRRKVEAGGVRNVNPVLGSAYELPWEDSTFDAIVCASALHVLEKPQVALGEMVRVLRPGGLLVAPTFLHREGLRAVLISTVLNLFGSFKRLDHEGLRRMVEEAGFHVEELDVVRGPMPLAFLVARSPVVRVAHVADEIARESAPTQPVPIEEEDAAGSLEAVDELPVEEEPAPGVPLPRELAPEAAGEPEAPPVEAAEVAPAAEEHAELAPAAEPPEPAAPAAEPTEEAPRPASRRPRRGPKAPSRVPVPAPTLRAVEFRYRASGEPKHVLLTGSFVGWSGKPEKTAAMVFDADAGAFVATIELPPGRHTYKYIVDGQWVPDPANPNAEPDGLGGVNSVREVE